MWKLEEPRSLIVGKPCPRVNCRMLPENSLKELRNEIRNRNLPLCKVCCYHNNRDHLAHACANANQEQSPRIFICCLLATCRYVHATDQRKTHAKKDLREVFRGIEAEVHLIPLPRCLSRIQSVDFTVAAYRENIFTLSNTP